MNPLTLFARKYGVYSCSLFGNVTPHIVDVWELKNCDQPAIYDWGSLHLPFQIATRVSLGLQPYIFCKALALSAHMYDRVRMDAIVSWVLSASKTK